MVRKRGWPTLTELVRHFGGLRSKLIIVDGATTHKEQLTWLLSSATSNSARYAALIVQQSPTPSKPSSCVRVLQGTWATISAASSRNCLPLLALLSPAPLIAPPRDARVSAPTAFTPAMPVRLCLRA